MAAPQQVDPGILKYATPTQRVNLEAVIEHGSMSAAARSLGKNYSSVRDSYMQVEAKAARYGYAP